MVDPGDSWILIRRSANGSEEGERLGRYGTFEAARLEAALIMCDLTSGRTDISVHRNGDSETLLKASGTPQSLVIRREVDD